MEEGAIDDGQEVEICCGRVPGGICGRLPRTTAGAGHTHTRRCRAKPDNANGRRVARAFCDFPGGGADNRARINTGRGICAGR